MATCVAIRGCNGKVTNYTTSIAIFKTKSFQKEFQKEKKKVQFQIKSDKIKE